MTGAEGLCVGFEAFSDPGGKLVVLGSLGPLSGSGNPKEMVMCSFSWCPLTLPRAEQVVR